MYKQSSRFHNSPSFGQRDASYGKVRQRKTAKVNSELLQMRWSKKPAERQREPDDLLQTPTSLVTLLISLSGGLSAHEFLTQLPLSELNSLICVLSDLGLFPKTEGPKRILEKVSSKHRTLLSNGERASAIRLITPIVESLLRDGSNCEG